VLPNLIIPKDAEELQGESVFVLTVSLCLLYNLKKSISQRHLPDEQWFSSPFEGFTLSKWNLG